jgi:predicted TIM-barrel fold metal-dependent hydrolase
MPHSIPTWLGDVELDGSLARLSGSRYPIFDTHLHIVDFTQETPGAECLLHYMDRTGIPKAVVFGLPVTKLFGAHERAVPRYYLDIDGPCYYYAATDSIVAEFVRAAPKEAQSRLVPLVAGFNPTDRYAIRHVERMFELYPGLWHGIGEVLLRHDDLTALTYGEAARANHPAMMPVYEFAADHNLPVLIHQNITSVAKSDHPIYLHELKEVLIHFPRTRLIFAHCGMSRRIEVPLYHEMIDRLLGQFENLFVDYSWIIFDTLICPHGRANTYWLALTEKYPDRILLGSDLVTNFERLGPEMQRYDSFLDELSAPTRRAICTENAERVYGAAHCPGLESVPPSLPSWAEAVALTSAAAPAQEQIPAHHLITTNMVDLA